jgi:hypothetical protein
MKLESARRDGCTSTKTHDERTPTYRIDVWPLRVAADDILTHRVYSHGEYESYQLSTSPVIRPTRASNFSIRPQPSAIDIEAFSVI